jgi:hypothetical protein
MTTARGLRNNNPGNIDYNPANQWQGQLPHDPAIEKRFARFDTPENGIRALARTLLTYSRKHGLRTVAGIIGRWAPGHENDTAAYVRSVNSVVANHANGAALDVEHPLVLSSLVTAIIHHENGGNPYEAIVVAEGVRRALV